MKHSMISSRAPLHLRGAVSEDSAPHDHVLNPTLSDIYRKLVELLIEVAEQKAKRKAIRLPGVKELTGESRSQIYARMNPKYAAHDETWPRPFYIGKSPRWWLHEVEAWLEAQASASATRH
jgi:predicted DNA-binding transcriptional regulator AlpA